MRLSSDGSIDGTYGTNGWVIRDVDPLHDERPMQVVERPGGGSVVFGYMTTVGSRRPHYFLRSDPNGVPDPTFGLDGQVVDSLGVGSYMDGSCLRLLPNGAMLVAGQNAVNDTVNVAVAMFEPDGRSDTTWGDAGCVRIRRPGSSYHLLGGLVQLDDGGWVIGGTAFDDIQTLNEHFYCHLPADEFGVPDVTIPPQLHYVGPGQLDAEIVHMLDEVVVAPSGRIVAVSCANYGPPAIYQLTVYRIGTTSVNLSPTEDQPSFLVRPNPIHDVFQVQFQVEGVHPSGLELIDMHGRSVHEFHERFSLNAGARVSLTWPEKVPAGMYLLCARSAGRRVAVSGGKNKSCAACGPAERSRISSCHHPPAA